MKVIVLGAGVIGVTTAYYLAREGAEVRVLDRQAGPGMETSFANAGELSYGMTSPWAAPGIPQKAVKWLFMRHRPLFIWPLLSPRMWWWGVKMLANCNETAYARNKGRMVRISNYSRDMMTELIATEPIEFDLRQQGTLQLFRTEKQLKGSKADQEVLAEYDSPYEVLDADQCVAVEPGLAHVREKFVGGLRLTADRTGDCRMFTMALAERAAAMGVSFRYGTTIERFLMHGDRITGVETDQGVETADAYVCALGPYAPVLLRQAGISAADLSDQGLFDHLAGHRRRRRRRSRRLWTRPTRWRSPGSATGSGWPGRRRSSGTTVSSGRRRPTRCATWCRTCSRRAATWRRRWDGRGCGP